MSNLLKRHPSLLPLSVITVLYTVITLRWGIIAAGDDHGWDLEPASRILLGARYGRDFFTTVPPLSYSILAQLLGLLGRDLWVIHAAWYGCWFLSLLGAYRLCTLIEPNRITVASALLLGTMASFPHLIALHLYNFLSYALAVWCGVWLVTFMASQRYFYLMAAAIASSLCLFCKQNIGIASLLMGVVLVTWFARVEGWELIRLVRVQLFFLAPFFLTAGLLFSYYGSGIDPTELFQLMFRDAFHSKGGIIGMLKAAIPRATFAITPVTVYQRAIQHLTSLVCFIVVISWVRKRTARPLHTSMPGHITEKAFLKLFIIVFVSLLIVEGSTFLFPVSSREVVDFFRKQLYWGWHSTAFRAFWLYVLVHSAWIFFLMKKRFPSSAAESTTYDVTLAFSVGLLFAFVVSQWGYAWLNSSLVLPVLAIHLVRNHQWNAWMLASVSIGFLLVSRLFFLTVNGFGNIQPIALKEFRYLRIDRSEGITIETRYPFLARHVSGHRTLWLIHPGPYSITGALPVPSIANLYADQYRERLEESLVKQWMTNPPERIVRGFFVPAPGSRWFASDFLNKWIQANYVFLDEMDGYTIYRYKGDSSHFSFSNPK